MRPPSKQTLEEPAPSIKSQIRQQQKHDDLRNLANQKSDLET